MINKTTDKNKVRIQVWIKSSSNDKLNEMWKDDSNRIESSKARKGDLVSLGLRLLYQARKTKTLEEINTYVKRLEDNNNGGGNNE